MEAPNMNNLPSPSFGYLGSNGGLWQMNSMLPQLSNSIDNQSYDGLGRTSPSPSSYGDQAMVSSTSTYHPEAQPSAFTMIPAPIRTPMQRFNLEDYTASPTTAKSPRSPSSDLYLCKICYAAVESRVSDDTTVHVAPQTCIICRGTTSPDSPKITTNNVKEEFDSSHHENHSVPCETSPAPPRTTIKPPPSRQTVAPNHAARHRPLNNEHRINKRTHKPTRNSVSHSSHERGGPFHCRFNDCNRGSGGRHFSRKDNRNTHERTVHGAGTQEADEGETE